MKRLFIIIGVLCVQFAAAQTVEDAFRYSDQNFYGTARSSAMGGAFSSLGGDISVAHTNPAGLAILRSSTASITPGLHFSTMKGEGINGEKTTFIVPSFGIILATDDEDSSMNNINFGISYSQSNNFNRVLNLVPHTVNKSFLDDIAFDSSYVYNSNLEEYILDPYRKDVLSNYSDPNAIIPSLAYNTYLISPTGKDGAYEAALFQGELLEKTSKITDKGSNGEFAFSVAGNFEHKIYVGATLGIQDINFKNTENYSERVSNPTKQTLLDKFYYDTYLTTKGTGINLKLGVIVRATDALRLGVSVHTPTFYSLEDEFSYLMESAFYVEPEKGKGTSFRQTFPEDETPQYSEYSYRTPWKFTFGGSYILGKIGLISVDYDLINYGSARFSNGDFDVVNQKIKDTYKLTSVLKIGTEIRLNKLFSLRAGYNNFGNMYESNTGISQKANLFSAGLGFRHKNFFADASYQHYNQEHKVNKPNFLSIQNMDRNTVKLTIGCKF